MMTDILDPERPVGGHQVTISIAELLQVMVVPITDPWHVPGAALSAFCKEKIHEVGAEGSAPPGHTPARSWGLYLRCRVLL